MRIVNKERWMKHLVKMIQDDIQRWKTERILLLFLNDKGVVFHKQIVSVGYNKYAAYYYPSCVTELMDAVKPIACVWSHNHVNDFPTPSENDDDVHLWFIEECQKRNIIPYDSIIVMRNNNSYYSYREHNRLCENIIEHKAKVATNKRS